MQGLPTNDVTTTSRELLPHVFTLIRLRRTVIFCGTICFAVAYVTTNHIEPGSSPVHLLCAVRTFLPTLHEAITRLVAKISKTNCKNTYKLENLRL